MHVTVSDYDLGSNVVSVDWLRMTPYASPCSFESRVFDAGAPANWDTLAWTGNTPAGTNLALGYRIGNTPTPDGSWTAFVPVASLRCRADGQLAIHPISSHADDQRPWPDAHPE